MLDFFRDVRVRDHVAFIVADKRYVNLFHAGTQVRTHLRRGNLDFFTK